MNCSLAHCQYQKKWLWWLMALVVNCQYLILVWWIMALVVVPGWFGDFIRGNLGI
jgi:hypothetical protein